MMPQKKEKKNGAKKNFYITFFTPFSNVSIIDFCSVFIFNRFMEKVMNVMLCL